MGDFADEAEDRALTERYDMEPREYDNTNKGVAFKNDYKTEDKHPYYKGKGNFNGQDFEFGIWIKESEKGKFLSFSFSEPYEKPQGSGYEYAKAQAEKLKPKDVVEEVESEQINLDDIPF